MSAPFRIEGLLESGQWTEEAVADEHHEFPTLEVAREAVRTLVWLGWRRNHLRIVDAAGVPVQP